MQTMHDYKVEYHLVDPDKPDELVTKEHRGSVHVVAPSAGEAARIAYTELKECFADEIRLDSVWPTVIRWTG